MSIPVKFKDPEANARYKFNWRDWLNTTEIITEIAITGASGITVGTSAIVEEGKAVTVFVSGGTAGEEYEVACKITTDEGRIEVRRVLLKVQLR